jgi:hypothetical protein
LVILIVVVLVFFFAFTNGFHDAANVVATIITVGTWDVVQSIQITFPSPPSFGIVNFPNGDFDNFDLRPPGFVPLDCALSGTWELMAANPSKASKTFSSMPFSDCRRGRQGLDS